MGGAMKVLLVDDDPAIRDVLEQSLIHHGFEVVAASGVKDALHKIVSQNFDVLLSDLHMPNAGDGFAVVSAMRHLQPDVRTIILSGFPDVTEAMEAICTDVDQVLSKPIPVSELLKVINGKDTNRRKGAQSKKETIATILEKDSELTIERWLFRLNQIPAFAAIPLTVPERVGKVSEILRNIITRLSKDRNLEAPAIHSPAAIAEGKLRRAQGYTVPLLMQQSRLFQASIFETVQRNRSTIDFSVVLSDLMLIADEVDSQLTQTIESFLESEQQEVA